jgi:hypothetical protein
MSNKTVYDFQNDISHCAYGRKFRVVTLGEFPGRIEQLRSPQK